MDAWAWRPWALKSRPCVPWAPKIIEIGCHNSLYQNVWHILVCTVWSLFWLHVGIRMAWVNESPACFPPLNCCMHCSWQSSFECEFVCNVQLYCATDVLGKQRELCEADAMVACQHALKLYDKELLKEACCMSHVQLNSGMLIKVVLSVFERYLYKIEAVEFFPKAFVAVHLGRSYQSLKVVEDQTWILPSSFAAGRWQTKLGLQCSGFQ